MRIAVIGDGLLGTTLGELSDELPFSHAEMDIASKDSILRQLDAHEPDVVINTAALHQMAACEADPERAFALNAKAAGLLASLVPTIYISTDYVFNEKGPHTEDLPGQQPRSVYGRSKLAGELATLEQGGVVVRVAGLYGHHRSHKGPSFPETILSSHDPIRLPSDQFFSPTYAVDAAERILTLARAMVTGGGCYPMGHADVNLTAPTGIYHAANRGSTCWAEWGEQIANYWQHQRHIIPFRSKDSLRPSDSTLKSTRLPQLPFYLDAMGRWAQRQGRPPFPKPQRDA